VISPFAFFRVASFFIGGLCDKPLCVFGLLFSHRGLCDKPLCVFWVASFFIKGLSDKPLCILGCLFSHQVFVMSQ
jgi:hypothetical protein